jgi:signal transduction histidine kinase
MVDIPIVGEHLPACVLAHELLNKLSVIVGYCDLLEEDARLDPKAQVQVGAIRNVALKMAEYLNTHQCALETAAREEARKSVASPKTVSNAKSA